MKAIDIDWDVDNIEELKTLPDTINIPDRMTDKEEISDYITRLTGYCHYGFELIDNRNTERKSGTDLNTHSGSVLRMI